MSSPKMPSQISTWFRRWLGGSRAHHWADSRADGSKRNPGFFGKFAALRIGLLASLTAGLAWWVGTSCQVMDPDYCADRSTCPFVQTDMGPVQLFCHPTRHLCVMAGPGSPNLCFADGDCTDPKHSRCDLSTNQCMACNVGDSTDTSCGHIPGRPLCANANDGSGPQCVGCQVNMDCMDPSAPICDNQQCRACNKHQDCEGTLHCDGGGVCTDSLVCIGPGDLTPELVGRCAQNDSVNGGRVIYVNTGDPNCDDTKGFLFTSPVCHLDQAVGQAKLFNRRYFRLVGSLYPLQMYNVLNDNNAYSFIGAPIPSKGIMNKAVVQSRGLAFGLTGNGTLALDSLVIQEINSDDMLVHCAGGGGLMFPTLIIRNSDLIGGTPQTMANPINYAVATYECSDYFQGNTIGVQTVAQLGDGMTTVHGNGIFISDSHAGNNATTILIENNIIAGNAGVAVNLGQTGTATKNFQVRFNTIYQNGQGISGATGAIRCSTAVSGNSMQVSRSIIMKNSTAGGSQFQFPQYCVGTDIVVGPTEPANPGFINKTFEPGTAFRLTPTTNNSDCCIDKVSPVGNEMLPTIDIDGIPRPQNVKWDIGASEYKP